MFNAVGSTRTSSAEKTAGLIVEIEPPGAAPGLEASLS